MGVVRVPLLTMLASKFFFFANLLICVPSDSFLSFLSFLGPGDHWGFAEGYVWLAMSCAGRKSRVEGGQSRACFIQSSKGPRHLELMNQDLKLNEHQTNARRMSASPREKNGEKHVQANRVCLYLCRVTKFADERVDGIPSMAVESTKEEYKAGEFFRHLYKMRTTSIAHNHHLVFLPVILRIKPLPKNLSTAPEATLAFLVKYSERNSMHSSMTTHTLVSIRHPSL